MNTVKQGKLTFTLINGETAYAVTACEKDAVEIVLPEKVNGLVVRKVEEYAFEDCKSLKQVIFPEPSEEAWTADEYLEEIGEYAFSGCISLKEVALPYGVRTVGRGAFYGCKALERASFDRAFVCGYAFSGCEKLVSVSPVSFVSEGAFRDCKSLKELPLAKGAREIDEDGFEHCEGLTEIVIPASVKRIGGLAFRGCYALKKATFEAPDGWVWHCRYTGKDYPLDLSDPARNAKSLGWADFDDGVSSWRRQ